jgi:hypothetical protein
LGAGKRGALGFERERSVLQVPAPAGHLRRPLAVYVSRESADRKQTEQRNDRGFHAEEDAFPGRKSYP